MSARCGELKSLRVPIARVFPHAYRAATSLTPSHGGTIKTLHKRPVTVSLLPKPPQASITFTPLCSVMRATLRVRAPTQSPPHQPRVKLSRITETSRVVRSCPPNRFRGKTQRVQPPLQRWVGWTRCASAPPRTTPRRIIGPHPAHTQKYAPTTPLQHRPNRGTA